MNTIYLDYIDDVIMDVERLVLIDSKKMVFGKTVDLCVVTLEEGLLYVC